MDVLKSIDKILSGNIRRLRKLRGKMTQAELAEAAGIPFRTLQSIEYGDSWPERINLEAIAHGLNVHPLELFRDFESLPEAAPAPRSVTPEEALAVLAEAIKTPASSSVGIPSEIAARVSRLPLDLQKELEAALRPLERKAEEDSARKPLKNEGN